MGAKVKPRPPKDDPGDNPEYREHVRARGCCMRWAGKCRGQVVAHHHGKADGGGGTSLRPSDYRTVPLCDCHHKQFHSGEMERQLADGWGVAAQRRLGGEETRTLLDGYFAEQMVKCLESWLMRDAKPSKILPRLRAFA